MLSNLHSIKTAHDRNWESFLLATGPPGQQIAPLQAGIRNAGYELRFDFTRTGTARRQTLSPS